MRRPSPALPAARSQAHARTLPPARLSRPAAICGALVLLLVLAAAWPAAANPAAWKSEWPKTDFSRKSVE